MQDDELNSMTEEDALALQAFFDGELSVRDAEAFEKRLGTDERLSMGVESHRLVQQEFRSWFIDAGRFATKPCDCWEDVAARIERDSRRSWWIGQWQGFRDFFSSPGPSRGAFAALAACLLATIVFDVRLTVSPFSTSPNSSESGRPFGASVANVDLQSPYSTGGAYASRDSRSSDIQLSRVSLGEPTDRSGSERIARTLENGQELTPFQQATAYNLENGLVRTSSAVVEQDQASESPENPARMPRGVAFQFFVTGKNGQVRRIGGAMRTFGAQGASAAPSSGNVLENRRNFLRSGMKTPGAEIDWIRSDREFRIVSPKSDEAPPVIWVANGTDLH